MEKVLEIVNTAKTYYLYDRMQNLVQVIQPKEAETGHTTPANTNTTASIQNGSFIYTYDILNRLATKRIPSGGTYTYTYDRLDREVLRLDPNSFRYFTKYDILGRVIMNGKQTTTTAPTGSESLFETPNNSTHNYTSVAFPTSSYDVYSVNYYDDYDWEKEGTQNESYTTTGVAGYPASNYPFILGMPTRIKLGVLQQNGTAPAFYNDDFLFYDDYGREIQRKATRGGIFSGNIDITWKQYDFPGRLLKSRLSHFYAGTTTYINERYTYDHASRLLDTYHQINDAGTEYRLSNSSYNERDELSQKKISYNGATPGQTVDYSYNIRKWLTQINDPDACNTDLFSMRLGYNTANATLNGAAKFSGNISWMEWRTGASCIVGGVSRNKAGYGFTYDGLQRLTAAKYGEYVTSSWTNLDRYNETPAYDLNGNITTLNRRGYISAGNYNTIDNLTYTYSDANSPNRLMSVADASGSTLGFPAASGSYTYDVNGNQISDGAKGFTAITYNHLNLPTKFTQGANTIEIQYDAAGRKLKKIPSGGATKSYIGAFEYSTSTVEAVYHSEGRARNNAGAFIYEYLIKDHLGNTRVAFTNTTGTIALVQENHYYAFGMSQAGWLAEPSPTNAYKYNGKELNTDFNLNLMDYGARWYDAGVGRWTTVDPLAGKYPNLSPYSYCANNPIIHIDPDGRDYGLYFDSKTYTVTVKATYYAVAGDVSSAQQAAKTWNDQSGANKYVVGKDADAVSYTINYEISVVEVAVDPKMGEMGSLNKAMSGGTAGEGNVYRVVPDSKLDANTNGTTQGGNYIQVKNSQKSSNTGAHEVGHTLGLVHNSKGLMTASSTDANRTGSPRTSDVSDIIKYPLDGKVNSETNPITGTTTNAGKGTLHNNTSSTAKGLKKGKVQ